MALIMVIGTASVLAIITAVIAVQSISNLRQAGTERAFERSLHVADAGVDHMLFLIRQQKQEDPTTDFDDYDTVDVAPPRETPLEEERQWVLDEAEAAAGDPGRLVTTREGDWIAMRAKGARLIYSVGYVPSYDAPRKIRVVRAEYDFAPFSPTTAILTDGDLSLGGELVQGNVHGNGDVTVGNSADVDGYVSASGDCDNCEGNTNITDPDNTGEGRARIEVPDIDPRANYSMSEYDLCSDGKVRTGPNYDAAGLALDGSPAVANPSTTPCSELASVLTDTNITGDFRGWRIQRYVPSIGGQGVLWRYFDDGTNYDGVYYIFQGSATIAGNPGSDDDPWEVTIFAEAVSSGTDEPDCSHTGGDIEVTGGGTISFNLKGEQLGFVAGRDLKLSGNEGSGNSTFSGVHAAHEQFYMTGNAQVEGAVLANDSCNTQNSPVDESALAGSAKVTYKGASVPLGSNIRTTLWLEI